jgi:hypothetical protein
MRHNIVIKGCPEGTTVAALADFLFTTCGIDIPADDTHVTVLPQNDHRVGFGRTAFISVTPECLANLIAYNLEGKTFNGRTLFVEPRRAQESK